VKRFLVLLVALAAGVAAAAVLVPGPAVTVDSTGISRATLDGQLSAIAASSDYQCYLDARLTLQSGAPSTGTIQVAGAGSSDAGGNGTYSTAFVDYWLTQMVNDQFLEQLAARHHLAVTPQGMALARDDLASTITTTLQQVAGTPYQHCLADGTQVLASMPASFVDAQVRAQAAGDLLEASAAGQGLTDASLAAYFDTHRSQFDTLCLSVIGAQTSAAAEQLRAEIAGGTPFAQVAANNGEQNGGSQGCVGASNPGYASIRSAIGTLPVGQVSAPIETSSRTFVIVEVTKATPTTFAAAHLAVLSALLASGEQQASAELTAAIRSARVSVDPRYGRWQPGNSVSITGPPHPPAGSVLSLTADIPGAAQAAAAQSQAGAASGGPAASRHAHRTKG
jgi:hypothetical protein